MLSELDRMQYNPSMSLKQNRESFKLSLQKATKKHISTENQNEQAKQNSTHQRKISINRRKKKQRWKVFTENKIQENYRVYARWRNKVKRMTRQFTPKHEQKNSKCVKTQLKKIWN